jgi:hypothetical protein
LSRLCDVHQGGLPQTKKRHSRALLLLFVLFCRVPFTQMKRGAPKPNPKPDRPRSSRRAEEEDGDAEWETSAECSGFFAGFDGDSQARAGKGPTTKRQISKALSADAPTDFNESAVGAAALGTRAIAAGEEWDHSQSRDEGKRKMLELLRARHSKSNPSSKSTSAKPAPPTKGKGKDKRASAKRS